MRALLPAALLALFAAWSGTFFYGASAAAAATGHLTLLAAAAWAWRDWDPLRLGWRGRWLPAALGLLAAASAAASPAPRAGWIALLLLPALVALPAAVARCWPARDSRRGLAAVAAVVAIAAVTALSLQVHQASGRAAQPLGHHLLLALWLATLLPLAAAPIAFAPARWRWLALAPPALGLAALVASRSVAGLGGALVGAALLLPARRRGWLLVPLAILAGLAAERIVLADGGPDPSLAARAVYWRAALAGAAARPLLGWGPGSTGWTAGTTLRPVPGVNPPGEVVGDLHSLPAQLLYELGFGAPPAVALLAILFVRRRRREADTGDGALVGRAGLAGLAGGATALLATPTFSTLAPWVALAVAAGAALARSDAPGSPAERRPARLAAWGYVAVAGLLAGRLDLAHAFHDRARAAPTAPTTEARRWLQRAVALDPRHPLYRARLGWLAPAASGEREGALRLAADGAPGVAPFALAAGAAAMAGGGRGGEALLARACATDPLSGLAPFLLATAAPELPEARVYAARALLAAPELGAAVELARQRPLLRDALLELQGWQGVDGGYRRTLARAVTVAPRSGQVRRLLWVHDTRADQSLSLLAFRRRPWSRPIVVGTVLVALRGAERLATLPAATALPTSAAAAFPPDCSVTRARRR